MRSILLLIFMTSATAALAQDCTGNVLFEDNFETFDPSWGETNKNVQGGGGKATLNADKDSYYWTWNGGFAYPTTADVCVDVTLNSDTPDANTAGAGPMFWIKDNNNFFLFAVTPDGRYWVSRRLDGKWAPNPISMKPSPDVKKGPHQTNSLHVHFEGQNVTLFVNGKEQTKIKLQSPGGSNYAGIFAQSDEKYPSTWDFTKFKVTEPKQQ
jgi:hypothetical protein